MPIIILGRDNVYQDGFGEIQDFTNDIQFWADASQGISTNASDEVTTWNDQSPNTFSGTPSTNTSSPPKLISNELNGNPVVRFFNGGDLIKFGNVLNSTFAGPDAEVTIFIVAKNRSSPDTPNVFFAKQGDIAQSENQRQFFLREDNDDYQFQWYSTLSTPVDFVRVTCSFSYLNNFHLNKIELDTGNSASSSIDFFVDGSDVGESSSIPNNTPDYIRSSNAQFSIGGIFGTSGPSSKVGNVDVAELRIYDNILNTQDSDTVESFLLNKWGL